MSERRLVSQLLQLLHRNRGAFSARARHRPVPPVAARLGADRDLEERGRAAGSGAARHRRRLREMARAQGEDADGELAGLLRAGGAHRSAGHGRDARGPRRAREAAPPFPLEELRAYLQRNAAALPEEYGEIAASLRASGRRGGAALCGPGRVGAAADGARREDDRRWRAHAKAKRSRWNRAASSTANCGPTGAR